MCIKVRERELSKNDIEAEQQRTLNAAGEEEKNPNAMRIVCVRLLWRLFQ